MNQLNSINRISTLLSRFVAEVKGLNTINQYGINYLSETVLIPIFKEIFGLQNLINLNSESKNFPGIDIGDKSGKIAFQITSISDKEKVKHTFRQFIDNELYKDFTTLYIYCISEKSQLKKDSTFDEINRYINFDLDIHIIDYKNILQKINTFTDYNIIQRIETLLDKQFSEIQIENYKEQLLQPKQETIYSNLIKISFPDILYTARIEISRNDLKKKKRIINDRDLIFQYKKENNLSFSSDWIDFQKQIYTFHDLTNRKHGISKIIDAGTVETLSPEDFYIQNSSQERAFKALLKYCFSKYAYYLGIEFLYESDLFVFKSENENCITRKESWFSGKRHADRQVVKVKINKKTNTVWYYTHLAFSIAFKYYDDNWYLEITPDWYITKDGHVKHFKMDKEVTSWLKRNERNSHVHNNVKFIANYLKYGKIQQDLFKQEINRRPKNFIELMNFIVFDNVPFFNENEWRLNENEENLKLMTDNEGILESAL